MTKKLEAIGPYTADHPGPFCTRVGQPVELRLRGEKRGAYTEYGYIADSTGLESWTKEGRYFADAVEDEWDLMNAREVPEPREFWMNEYKLGLGNNTYKSKEDAAKAGSEISTYIRTIHLREVLDEPATLYATNEEAEKWQTKTL